MKNLIAFSLILSLSLSVVAQNGVQRTTESSYEDYLKYLDKSGGVTFSQAYIHLSSVTEMETPLLEKCLEEMYLGAPSQSTCLAAVKSLSSKPLNQARREVLFSFLSRMSKVRSIHQSFYQSLRIGLLKSHPELARIFHVDLPDQETKSGQVKVLEMKAWKSALSKNLPIAEASLLINGKKVSKLEAWTAPDGIYQWSLISNTHAPIVRLGTFSQFASESLKELEPLAQGGCTDLTQLQAQKFGLVKIEVFADKKCIAEFGMSTPVVASKNHLGSSTSMVKIDETSSRHWVWPILIMAGAGLAASLKDKNVQVQWPGSN